MLGLNLPAKATCDQKNPSIGDVVHVEKEGETGPIQEVVEKSPGVGHGSFPSHCNEVLLNKSSGSQNIGKRKNCQPLLGKLSTS